MLGSRAPHILPGAALVDSPRGPEGGPEGGPNGRGGPSDPPTPSAVEGPPATPNTFTPLSNPTPPSARRDEAGAVALASLTPRELEVLRLMARGYSNAEIAEAFVVSEGTVKTHVKRVLSKRVRMHAGGHGPSTAACAGAPTAGLGTPGPEPLRLRAPR
jgi:DNA-binding CsgD family transcriptional regulator